MIDQRFMERAQFFSNANRRTRWHEAEQLERQYTEWVVVTDTDGTEYDSRPANDMPDHAYEMAEAMEMTYRFEWRHCLDDSVISDDDMLLKQDAITHDSEYMLWREAMDDDEEYQWLNSSDAAWE